MAGYGGCLGSASRAHRLRVGHVRHIGIGRSRLHEQFCPIGSELCAPYPHGSVGSARFQWSSRPGIGCRDERLPLPVPVGNTDRRKRIVATRMGARRISGPCADRASSCEGGSRRVGGEGAPRPAATRDPARDRCTDRSGVRGIACNYEPEGCSPTRRGSQSRTACPSLTRTAAPPASSRSRRAQCLRSTGIRNAIGSATTITQAARCLHRSPAGEARNRSASCRLRPIVSGRVLMSTSSDGTPLPRR